jgi:hypothetical protein
MARQRPNARLPAVNLPIGQPQCRLLALTKRSQFNRLVLNEFAQTDRSQPPQRAQKYRASNAGRATGNGLSLDTKRDIADCFLRLAALPTFPLDRLSRYEHLLWRQTRQTISTLESLRRRRPQPRRSSFPFSFRRREPAT